MSGHAKVIFIPRDFLLKVLRGEARIGNLPGDAEIVAFTACEDRHGTGLGLRVHSKCFPLVAPGSQLPRATATIEHRKEVVNL